MSEMANTPEVSVEYSPALYDYLLIVPTLKDKRPGFISLDTSDSVEYTVVTRIDSDKSVD